MNFLKIGLLLSALALFIFACTQTSPSNNANNANRANNQAVVTNAANQSTANSGTLTTGQSTGVGSASETFKTVCAKCHKETGEGGEVTIDSKKLKVPNFKTDRMKKEEDEDFVDAITNGIPEDGMPAFKDKLNDQQIKELVKYIRTDIQEK